MAKDSVTIKQHPKVGVVLVVSCTLQVEDGDGMKVETKSPHHGGNWCPGTPTEWTVQQSPAQPCNPLFSASVLPCLTLLSLVDSFPSERFPSPPLCEKKLRNHTAFGVYLLLSTVKRHSSLFFFLAVFPRNASRWFRRYLPRCSRLPVKAAAAQANTTGTGAEAAYVF